MIELHDDQLRFSFPEISRQLRILVERHIAAHLPAVLAEEPKAALEKLFQERWRAYTRNQTFRHEAAGQLESYDAADFTRTFRWLAFSAAGLSPQESADEDQTEASSARFYVEFQRTLRIPDDGKDYPLPAGLGRFALRHVHDFAGRAPARWLQHGGVMMPMYQAEAMWMNFDGGNYPVAVKIAAGKINAINGEDWHAGLSQRPSQNYAVIPGQPWLDGFAVERGVIRQFVAMPLGGGHSVEEQLTGKAEHGGVQIQVYPLRPDVYFEESIADHLPTTLGEVIADLIPTPRGGSMAFLAAAAPCPAGMVMDCAEPDMGLGAGGRMKQEIYQDERPLSDWDQQITSRCFVHLCNSAVWREITGDQPPQPALTAVEYQRAGLPWFDYYREDASALAGSDRLKAVKSVGEFGKAKGDASLPGDGPVDIKKVVPVGPKKVREWAGE